MAKGPWFDAVIAGLGKTGEGFTFSSGSKKGPNGEKTVSLTFEDPLRSGQFNVDLPDDATDEQVTSAVRAGWKKFVRAHPVTRGSST